MKRPHKEVIGNATLYLGEALAILQEIGSAAVGTVISDPPYGKSTAINFCGKWKGRGIAGDESTAVRDAALNIAASPFAIFSAVRSPWPEGTKATVVWEKGEHTGMGNLKSPWKPNFELIHIGGVGWHSTKRISGVVRVSAITGFAKGYGHHAHPFEKPVEIMEHLIVRAPEGTICDPFMGSGTTGVACASFDRPFIGIEIEKRFFDSACRRIERAQSQLVMPLD